MASPEEQVSAVRALHAPKVYRYENERLHIPASRWVKCAHCREAVEDDTAEVEWPCDTAQIVYTKNEIDAVLHDRPHKNPAECPERIDVTPYLQREVEFICGC